MEFGFNASRVYVPCSITSFKLPVCEISHFLRDSLAIGLSEITSHRSGIQVTVGLSGSSYACVHGSLLFLRSYYTSSSLSTRFYKRLEHFVIDFAPRRVAVLKRFRVAAAVQYIYPCQKRPNKQCLCMEVNVLLSRVAVII